MRGVKDVAYRAPGATVPSSSLPAELVSILKDITLEVRSLREALERQTAKPQDHRHV
jgi:hypothetical protein